MMKIQAVLGKNYGANSYVVIDEKTCVIDPGFNTEFGVDYDKVDIVINTHCHYDHVANNYLFTNAVFYMHEKEIPYAKTTLGTAELFKARYEPQDFKPIPKKVNLGEVVLEVIHTPGHTPGSICLYEKKSKTLISGDTVFSDGIGRIDLEGGNARQLKKSIEKLSKLEVNHLLPGHGFQGDGNSIKLALEIINQLK